MRALITGAAGFTAQHLVEHLRTHWPEAEVYGTDVRLPPAGMACHFTVADLLDNNAVADLIAEVGPTHIFHLAGLNTSPDPMKIYQVNLMGTLVLLEAVLKSASAPSTRVLIVGSSAEYGQVTDADLPISEDCPLRPTTHYGVSKVAQGLLGLKYYVLENLRVVRARPFNLVGPGQPTDFVCASLARQIVEAEKQGRPASVEVGNMSARRDFVDVRDAVRAYVVLATTARDGEVYNVGSGTSWSASDLLGMLAVQTSARVEVRQNGNRMRPCDPDNVISDTAKITRETGWHPTIPLENSLSDLLDYYRGCL